MTTLGFRGSSDDLGDNLQDDGFTKKPDDQAHHLIPASTVGSTARASDNKEILLQAEDDWSGFDFDDAQNGIFLPSTVEGALETGLAKHDGFGGAA